MTNILFQYNNLLDATATSLTASSEATGFPAANLQHFFRTKVWRTAGGVAGTANLVIDFGSALAVNCVALANYNWTSAPGTFNLEFNATDAWGAPSATETLTWAANPTANGNNGVIFKKFSATRTYRFARLNVVYATGDWDLGRISLGQYLEPTYNYLFDYNMDIIDPSMVSETVTGQEHVDVITKYRNVSFSFTGFTQAQWELLQKMINNAGANKDIFVALDYDAEPDEMTWYGKFAKLPRMDHRDGIRSASFSFKESR